MTSMASGAGKLALTYVSYSGMSALLAVSSHHPGQPLAVPPFAAYLKLDTTKLMSWQPSPYVSSVENYSRGIFLFNTWQQYGDGRTRTRNGLLSEKLQLSEMPLEENLHEVCRRAVTEEEMQRVVDASTTIQPGYPAPAYDPSYKTPLRVVDEIFLDHTVEIEQSKSYPGLVTVYHLYTVDILCTGLPTLNFNTLEYEAPDEAGHRKLKYIHAWVWMKFESIQRYLFEGSVLKERITKGTFTSPEQLRDWLAQFDIDLHSYGTGQLKSVAELWKEVEAEKTHL
ncbi:IMP3, partial [Symbiodinium natans]